MHTPVRAVAAVVAAAVIGFVLARAGSGGNGSTASVAPLSGHAATASLRVSYPAGWRRLSASPAGLLPPLGQALALAPKGSGRELVIGTVPVGGGSAGELPVALRAAVAQPPAKQVVDLGGHHFVRYMNLSPRGQSVTESLYLLPTTGGTIGAVCAAQQPSASFTASCERVLATLRLTSGSVLALGVDAAYATRLNTIVDTLNDARSAVGPGLRTGSLGARVRAARRLAAVHAQAAAAVGRLSPSAAGVSTANRILASALHQTAGAYRALASAITNRRQAAYRAAETKLAAGGRVLGTAFDRLQALGYRIG